MKKVFADTSCYVALLLRGVRSHDLAERLSREFDGQVVTTDWVMVELGNFCSSVAIRQGFVFAERTLDASPHVHITPEADYSDGLQIYD